MRLLEEHPHKYRKKLYSTVHVFYVSAYRYTAYCSTRTAYSCSGLIFVPTSSPYDQYSTHLRARGTAEVCRWPHGCSPPACSGRLLRARRSTTCGRGRLWCNRLGHIFFRHRALRNGLSMIARTYCNPGQRIVSRPRGSCTDWTHQQPTCYSLSECSVCLHRVRRLRVRTE